MVQKSLHTTKLIKGSFPINERKSTSRKNNDEKVQERIDICLNCEKPEKECKGNCFGRSR